MSQQGSKTYRWNPPLPNAAIGPDAVRTSKASDSPTARGSEDKEASDPKDAERTSKASDSPTARGSEDKEASDPKVEGWKGFSESSVRRAFVRKVYLILLLQLSFTIAIIVIFDTVGPIHTFLEENPYVIYIALPAFLITYIALACVKTLRRSFPLNLLMLSLFTIIAAVLLASITCFFNAVGIVFAVLICAIVCLLVTIFSFITKFDFTSCAGILIILMFVLLVFGIVCIFVKLQLMPIYAALGALLFTVYLAYDTQLIVGGKTVELSPEEYVLGVLHLYLDVYYIFVFTLMLVGGVCKSKSTKEEVEK